MFTLYSADGAAEEPAYLFQVSAPSLSRADSLRSVTLTWNGERITVPTESILQVYNPSTGQLDDPRSWLNELLPGQVFLPVVPVARTDSQGAATLHFIAVPPGDSSAEERLQHELRRLGIVPRPLWLTVDPSVPNPDERSGLFVNRHNQILPSAKPIGIPVQSERVALTDLIPNSKVASARASAIRYLEMTWPFLQDASPATPMHKSALKSFVHFQPSTRPEIHYLLTTDGLSTLLVFDTGAGVRRAPTIDELELLERSIVKDPQKSKRFKEALGREYYFDRGWVYRRNRYGKDPHRPPVLASRTDFARRAMPAPPSRPNERIPSVRVGVVPTESEPIVRILAPGEPFDGPSMSVLLTEAPGPLGPVYRVLNPGAVAPRLGLPVDAITNWRFLRHPDTGEIVPAPYLVVHRDPSASGLSYRVGEPAGSVPIEILLIPKRNEGGVTIWQPADPNLTAYELSIPAPIEGSGTLEFFPAQVGDGPVSFYPLTPAERRNYPITQTLSGGIYRIPTGTQPTTQLPVPATLQPIPARLSIVPQSGSPPLIAIQPPSSAPYSPGAPSVVVMVQPTLPPDGSPPVWMIANPTASENALGVPAGTLAPVQFYPATIQGTPTAVPYSVPPTPPAFAPQPSTPPNTLSFREPVLMRLPAEAVYQPPREIAVAALPYSNVPVGIMVSPYANPSQQPYVYPSQQPYAYPSAQPNVVLFTPIGRDENGVPVYRISSVEPLRSYPEYATPSAPREFVPAALPNGTPVWVPASSVQPQAGWRVMYPAQGSPVYQSPTSTLPRGSVFMAPSAAGPQYSTPPYAQNAPIAMVIPPPVPSNTGATGALVYPSRSPIVSASTPVRYQQVSPAGPVPEYRRADQPGPPYYLIQTPDGRQGLAALSPEQRRALPVTPIGNGVMAYQYDPNSGSAPAVIFQNSQPIFGANGSPTNDRISPPGESRANPRQGAQNRNATNNAPAARGNFSRAPTMRGPQPYRSNAPRIGNLARGRGVAPGRAPNPQSYPRVAEGAYRSARIVQPQGYGARNGNARLNQPANPRSSNGGRVANGPTGRTPSGSATGEGFSNGSAQAPASGRSGGSRQNPTSVSNPGYGSNSNPGAYGDRGSSSGRPIANQGYNSGLNPASGGNRGGSSSRPNSNPGYGSNSNPGAYGDRGSSSGRPITNQGYNSSPGARSDYPSRPSTNSAPFNSNSPRNFSSDPNRSGYGPSAANPPQSQRSFSNREPGSTGGPVDNRFPAQGYGSRPGANAPTPGFASTAPSRLGDPFNSPQGMSNAGSPSASRPFSSNRSAPNYPSDAGNFNSGRPVQGSDRAQGNSATTPSRPMTNSSGGGAGSTSPASSPTGFGTRPSDRPFSSAVGPNAQSGTPSGVGTTLPLDPRRRSDGGVTSSAPTGQFGTPQVPSRSSAGPERSSFPSPSPSIATSRSSGSSGGQSSSLPPSGIAPSAGVGNSPSSVAPLARQSSVPQSALPNSSAYVGQPIAGPRIRTDASISSVPGGIGSVGSSRSGSAGATRSSTGSGTSGAPERTSTGLSSDTGTGQVGSSGGIRITLPGATTPPQTSANSVSGGIGFNPRTNTEPSSSSGTSASGGIGFSPTPNSTRSTSSGPSSSGGIGFSPTSNSPRPTNSGVSTGGGIGFAPPSTAPKSAASGASGSGGIQLNPPSGQTTSSTTSSSSGISFTPGATRSAPTASGQSTGSGIPFNPAPPSGAASTAKPAVATQALTGASISSKPSGAKRAPHPGALVGEVERLSGETARCSK